ncbi:putative bacteriophage tail protein GP47 Mu-like protein [Fusobacterium sp. CAG:439]|nr:putative bacteriophage tail protein GP47 Mu-like protein [Fusobacterium sp. CAG:439]
MAGYKKKTLKEIQAGIISDYTTRIKRETGIDAPLLPKAVVRSLAWSVAGVASMQQNYLAWVYLQIHPKTCSFPVLKMWGSLLGVEYKTGAKTTLQVEIINVTAASVISGTLWKSPKNGVVYSSLSTVSPIGGTAVLSVEAKTSGPAGNLNPGEELDITNPYEGIPDKAVVKSVLVTGSTDEEIEDYRNRVLIAFKRKAQGGSLVDYFLWGTKVSGIRDVFPYVLESGTIVLYLVADGSGKDRTPSGSVTPNPFPEWENGNMKVISGSGLFYQAAMAINGTEDMKNTRRPAGAVVELREPNYTGYRIEITELSSATNEINTKIKDAVISYLDTKKPNILALGYTKQDATINSGKLNAAVQNAIDTDGGTYTSFVLKNSAGEIINEDILGIGSLAYLEKLKINGVDVVL